MTEPTQTILAERVISVSELKKNPSAVMENQDAMPIAVLNHNRVMAYIVPAKRYEELLEYVADLEVERKAIERLNDGSKPVKMSLQDLTERAEKKAKGAKPARRKGELVPKIA